MQLSTTSIIVVSTQFKGGTKYVQSKTYPDPGLSLATLLRIEYGQFKRYSRQKRKVVYELVRRHA